MNWAASRSNMDMGIDSRHKPSNLVEPAVELLRRNPTLFYVALIHILLMPIFLSTMLIDARQVLGVNAWLKPTKFALSIAAYCAAMGWILGYLRLSKFQQRAINQTIAATMLVEMVVITLQAARGTTSHFNNTTPLDGALFSIMGLAIAINTVINIWVFILLLRNANISPDPRLSPAYLTGLRLGLLIFIVGALEGGSMLAIQKHTVGATDGGPGLPIVNWSTVGGDLRVAHFIGLHALQLIPLMVFSIEKKWGAVNKAVAWVIGLLYFAGFNFFYIQALLGQPIIG